MVEKSSSSEITLITKDLQKFTIDIRFKNMCKLISNILEDSSTDEEIPLDIETPVMQKVLEFAAMHFFNPPKMQKPIKSNDLLQNVNNQLNYKFIKDYTIESVKPLLMAAFYLDMQSLQDLCICRIATEFYFEPNEDGIENLKNKFGITQDITPEIEDQIKQEFPWAFTESEKFLDQKDLQNQDVGKKQL